MDQIKRRHLVFREVKHHGPVVDGYWFTDDLVLSGTLHSTLLFLVIALYRLMGLPLPPGPAVLLTTFAVFLGPYLFASLRRVQLRCRRSEIEMLVGEWCKTEAAMSEGDIVCDGSFADVLQVLPGFTPPPAARQRGWIPMRCRALLGLNMLVWGFLNLFGCIDALGSVYVFATGLVVTALWQALRIKECRVEEDVLHMRKGWRLPLLGETSVQVSLREAVMHCFFAKQWLLMRSPDGQQYGVCFADFPHRHRFLKALFEAAGVEAARCLSCDVDVAVAVNAESTAGIGAGGSLRRVPGCSAGRVAAESAVAADIDQPVPKSTR